MTHEETRHFIWHGMLLEAEIEYPIKEDGYKLALGDVYVDDQGEIDEDNGVVTIICLSSADCESIWNAMTGNFKDEPSLEDAVLKEFGIEMDDKTVLSMG